MPAKMPETRIKPEAGRIMDIPVGGEAIVEVFAVHVDVDRSCYLDPEGKIAQTDEGLLAVKVRRDQDGFHLYLNRKVDVFNPRPLGEFLKKLIPVCSISEEDKTV